MFGGNMHAYLLWQRCHKQAACPRFNLTSFIQQKTGSEPKVPALQEIWDIIIIIYVLMIQKFPSAIKAWVCKVQGKKLPLVLRWSHRWNSPEWTIHTEEATENQPK